MLPRLPRVPLLGGDLPSTKEQREQALQQTRETLAQLKGIIEDLGFTSDALPIAMQLYTQSLQSIVVSADDETTRARYRKEMELAELEGIDMRNDVATYVGISALDENTLDRRLEIARSRKVISPVADLLPELARASLQARDDFGGDEAQHAPESVVRDLAGLDHAPDR